ncbi:transposase [Catellatospora sp. KI3]|uniref:transposase n=1 Tax=Catellatospora sp. KI3 TaxID=3041620 RepID=UPI002482EE75|nr:transposase [Catellatospora sp. KI3]MDI1463433.1 transposase [Catellatospora sp. KI3]
MTGLTRDQVDDLVERVTGHGLWPLRRRRALDPRRAVVAVLLYLRHNLSQPLLAELFGCSQPTISRLVTLLLPVLTEVLAAVTQATAGRELRSTVRVDGFLVPIGDRRKDTYTSGMYSGKRHRCGFNVQVVASWHGRLVMTGRPQPGAMHDARAFRESGLADVFTGRMHADGGPGGFADTAYTGTGLMVPKRRTGPDQPFSEHLRAFNKTIASRRACVERVIAHLRNWKILATGYRRLLTNFAVTLASVTALEIYRTSTSAS